MDFFNDISEEEIEKFRPLLDRPIDEVKTDLQNLASNYYNSIINNNVELYNSTFSRINQYLEFNINEINEYLNYCFVIASNEIMKKLSNSKRCKIYNPAEVDLEFRTHYTKKNEHYLKREGLTDNEIEILSQYIKEKHDITCLSHLLNNEDVINKLKPKTILPTGLTSITINTNYVRGRNIKNSGELYFAFDKLFTADYIKENLK